MDNEVNVTNDELTAVREAVGEIDQLLLAQREREQASESLEPRVLNDATRDLAPLVEILARIVSEQSGWVAGNLDMARLAARAEENADLAHLLLDDGGSTADSHQRLYDLRRASFHVRRSVEQLAQFDAEVVRITRETDRRENERDFVNG